MVLVLLWKDSCTSSGLVVDSVRLTCWVTGLHRCGLILSSPAPVTMINQDPLKQKYQQKYQQKYPHVSTRITMGSPWDDHRITVAMGSPSPWDHHVPRRCPSASPKVLTPKVREPRFSPKDPRHYGKLPGRKPIRFGADLRQ